MVCDCEICISVSMVHYELNSWRSRHKAKLVLYYEISHSRRYDQERETNMNTLMKYIQMVLANIKEQVMHKYLPTLEILIHPLILFENWGLFWDIFAIAKK